MIVILTALPGCGKSTYAKKLAAQHVTTDASRRSVVVSADDYFMVDGEYRFDVSKRPEAHRWCFRQFMQATQSFQDCDLIVVDNVNLTNVDRAPYVLAGEAFGHTVQIVMIRCPVELSISRNTHGVPADTIRQFALAMEMPLSRWGAPTILSHEEL